MDFLDPNDRPITRFANGENWTASSVNSDRGSRSKIDRLPKLAPQNYGLSLYYLTLTTNGKIEVHIGISCRQHRLDDRWRAAVS